jgi:photosystem II stability/assembly factor-like uncharacterized protein
MPFKTMGLADPLVQGILATGGRYGQNSSVCVADSQPS